MNNNSSKLKLGIITGLIVIVGLIGFYSAQTISRRDKVQVSVATIPSDATVTIDGQTTGNGNSYLPAGDHQVVVKKTGFTTYSATLTFTKPTGVIDVGLQPESAEAMTWAQQHTTDYTALEGRAGSRADASGQKFADLNPIVANLPFSNLLFTIGYIANPTDASGNSILITIDAPEGYRQAAINKITEWGFNPAQLTIIFKSYENPFSL